MRPRLAVWKFTSCDGCQLTLLDCEDALLALAETVEIAWFLEASTRALPGPYDLSIVEGSMSTPDEVDRIREVRRQSRALVCIGACATAGGVQALRNLADVEAWKRQVYATPEHVRTLATSTPPSAHVAVDFELRGCPPDKGQLLDVITAFLHGRRPAVPRHTVCVACKAAGQVCVVVARGEPCLGPITHAGCGALCPSRGRGCYGCFGPSDAPNPPAMARVWDALGGEREALRRALRGVHPHGAFADEAARLDGEEP